MPHRRHHHGHASLIERREEAEPLDPSPPSIPSQDAVLVGRDDENCGDGKCTKPVSTTTTMTLPIVLGIVYVHRFHLILFESN